LVLLVLAPPVAAWVQYLVAGLPAVSSHLDPAETGPHGFPFWLRYSHYFNCHTLENVLHPQSLLAYEMNYETLNRLDGAPLRLRIEHQLGYKMVKWIRSIEFIADVKQVGKGYARKNEDDEYFDLIANI
jgi:DMSO/TMAO reductase YedYZ molybdopterin-dependent catalytic subunit